MSGIGRRRAAARAEGGEAYAERRREIIAAAAEVFGEKGYRGASLAEIAEAVGSDRASLYYYIRSKEEAFHEIVRDAAEANALQAETIASGEGTAPDKIRQLMTALMVSYAEHPYLFVYIQEDLTRVSDAASAWSREMRRINKRYDDAVVTIVQSGIDDRSVRPVASARLLANAVIGMVNWSHRWYRRNERTLPPSDEIGGAFAEAILGGIQASSRGTPNGRRRTR
ncbi:MAG: hypothetical protein NVS3B18_15500 [Candidatus Dormibacteria bacterium]